MNKNQNGTTAGKSITLPETLTLLLGLSLAFATSALANSTPKFVYVANDGDSTASAYAVDSSTGTLHEIAGSPFATGIWYPSSVTAEPSGRFIYVVNYCDTDDCVPGTGNVSAYTINSATGALRAVVGSPYEAGNQPDSITVEPSGRFVYVANYGGAVSAYAINSSTGALRAIAGSPFAAGSFPNSVTVDPSGRFAYVANSGDNTVSAYAINSSTGALRAVAGSPFAAGGGPYSVTVDPSGRFAYVANQCDASNDCSAGTVSAYIINSSSGALHAVTGSPFAAGARPQSVTVHPSGRFAYVANGCIDLSNCKGTVSAFALDNSTGALHAIAGSPFAAGFYPNSVTVDPSGRFAYAPNYWDDTVSVYSINGSTGVLHAVAGSPYPTGNFPISVAVVGQALSTPALTLTPRSLAYGNLPIHTSSAAQSVTVTNTSSKTVVITSIALRGTAPGQYAFTDNCGKSLTAYATCTLEAIFKPTRDGEKSAYLDVNGGGGGRSVMLTGTGK